MRLCTLEPDTPEFILYLTLTWRWIQDRPKLFPHTGGFVSLHEYLEKAQQENEKQIGIFVVNEMKSLITIQRETNDNYCFHVTSPRKTNHSLIASAVYAVGYDLFKRLGAKTIYSGSLIYKGKHRHFGSTRLMQLCGLTPTGEIEKDDYGNEWEYYELSRKNWLKYHYGQAEDRTKTESGYKSKYKSAVRSETGIHASAVRAAV